MQLIISGKRFGRNHRHPFDREQIDKFSSHIWMGC